MEKVDEAMESLSIRVRYAETDAMKIVHHSSYVAWLELARTEWLRLKGHAYDDLEAQGLQIPVLGLQLEYLKSAEFGDVVEVKLWPVYEKGVRFEFVYEVSKAGVLLTKGSTQHAFVKGGRPTRIPKWFLDFC